MLRSEDRGIDRATVLNDSGVRIAAACSIETLMGENFWLLINDKKYYVQPPIREKITSEELTRLGDVRALVAQLYEALNVGEYQLSKERELQGRLEKLNEQIGPLERKSRELNQKALRKANYMTWLGLGLMSVQFGVLARLTWWEYSWDIMEPVTYFVTYGTGMMAYAYFAITKQDYILPDIKDRQQLIALHKSAKKNGLDINQYNKLKREIAEIENDIRRLRDPLCLHLPAPPVKAPTYSATEISTAKKIKDFITEATSGDAAGFASKLKSSELLKISNFLQKIKTPKK
uniref:Calcium uniporter protein n=1 Tax=Culicoides sonorensis TaxID=179676 RepID=A0A336KU11_CULSO